MDFFNDIHRQASKLKTILEESQTEKSKELDNFKKTFKVRFYAGEWIHVKINWRIETDKHPLLYKQEEAAKEEKDALEKIAVILANLTSRKTAMVR